MNGAIKAIVPASLKNVLRRAKDRHIVETKHSAEIWFWRSRLELDEGVFGHSHYERLMLGMAGEPNGEFLTGKIVADFGCGPRGSLVWASEARLRIGIDVLADQYADEFTSNIVAHDMIYLKCTERVIPLPSNLVDVMFTMNAIDHVDQFSEMCAEIVRVIRPGGLFIGSFNLEEPASATEPQRLTEATIRHALLDALEIETYRTARRAPADASKEYAEYARFFENDLVYTPGEEGLLWVRAKKPLGQ
jgi:SAM-dependent methyltransferase